MVLSIDKEMIPARNATHVHAKGLVVNECHLSWKHSHYTRYRNAWCCQSVCNSRKACRYQSPAPRWTHPFQTAWIISWSTILTTPSDSFVNVLGFKLGDEW